MFDEIVHEDHGGRCSDLVDGSADVLCVGGMQMSRGFERDYFFNGGVCLGAQFAFTICGYPRVKSRFIMVALCVEDKVTSGVPEFFVVFLEGLSSRDVSQISG